MIYLDNAATTKPNESALKRAETYLYRDYYNPSALYAEGYNINLGLREARKNILSHIADCKKYELIFTSGGTEADNQAVFGGGKRGNIIITKGEHSAIYSAANELKQRGLEVRYAELNPDGGVNAESLLSLVDDKTSLVSVIHVGNETGAVNDILSLAAEVKKINRYTLFHSDGVQAFGKIDFRLSDCIDMYSVSAHKIGGIKGCGALIKKSGLKIKPYIYGGGQENGLRSGTENVFSIKCFEYAAEEKFQSLNDDYNYVSELKKLMIENLDKTIFGILSSETASPYILSVYAEGVRGETILHEADDNGVIIGTGSACSSNEKNRYSRVILACGLSERAADGVLRLSFSPQNSREEIIKAARILNDIVSNRKRVMS